MSNDFLTLNNIYIDKIIDFRSSKSEMNELNARFERIETIYKKNMKNITLIELNNKKLMYNLK